MPKGDEGGTTSRSQPEPHPTRGVVVAIALKGVDASAQPEQAARISEIMDRYSFAYTLEWR
jgi:hypothetical protein